MHLRTRQNNTTAGCGGRGFSLVEMLVSISVVGLLIGLLMPVIGQVRQSQRQLLCQSNLRQMTTAAQQYAAIHQSYPIAIWYRERDGVIERVAWDWVTTFDGEVVGPGPLWAYSTDPGEVMQAPEYHGPANFEGDPHTGYNYNTTYVGGEAAFVHTGWDPIEFGDRRPLRAGMERRPSQTAIFGCGGWSGGTNKFMRSPSDEHAYAGGQAFYFDGCTNVAWLDGHVSTVCQPQDGDNPTDQQLQMLGYPANGFLSDDDSAYRAR